MLQADSRTGVKTSCIEFMPIDSFDHADEDFWVFAYGSLMWRPGFAHEERAPARLIGLHRALCVYSFVHRGTPEKPGLVLGLDRGGACRGIAYRVDRSKRAATVAYLAQLPVSTGDRTPRKGCL